MAALIVPLLILVLVGGGGFVYSVLSYVLVAALALWAIGFVLRSSAGGRGRWYRW